LPDWFTTQEAAELSGFHPEYVRRLARQGKIGAEKKGWDWWIDRDVLHAYLQTVEDLGPQKYDPRGDGEGENRTKGRIYGCNKGIQMNPSAA
jgi:excisionase family DNA binding protein